MPLRQVGRVPPHQPGKSYFVDHQLIRASPHAWQALARVGWRAADLEMMRTWFFWDEETFSLTNIDVVVDAAVERTWCRG